MKVLVSKDAGRVRITGTPAEREALASFVELITRHGGRPAGEVRRRMKEARRGWTTHRAYRLPKAQARALFNALAPDDVPVLVAWKGKRLRVDATPQDQKTIARVVDILRGHRL